jgi:propanediol dehydratase large subunit
MAEEALLIARLIVTKRVQEEEISRGRLAQTPPGLVEVVERNLQSVMQASAKADANGPPLTEA